MQLATLFFALHLLAQFALVAVDRNRDAISALPHARPIVAAILITYCLGFGGQLKIAITHGHMVLAVACLLGRSVAELLTWHFVRTGDGSSWAERRMLELLSWIPTVALFAPFAVDLVKP